MKTTMIFAESGDTYLSVAYKPGEVTQKNVKLQSTLHYAEINGSEMNGFSVRFRIPYFRKYDRAGFISKQSAVNYEQDILDEHFGDFLAEDPSELSGCESAT
ncbi:MAG: hypothetical protein J6O50_10345 [Ruminiclostridium sp.]|nr:hypothetical protein [Ruminiclostridium sp.]